MADIQKGIMAHPELRTFGIKLAPGADLSFAECWSAMEGQLVDAVKNDVRTAVQDLQLLTYSR